jgi:hypothetical protein
MRSIAPILPPKTESPFRAIGSIAVTLACLAGAARIGAQTKRCDLVGRDTTISGNPAAFKHCLDLTALNGKTVNVPLNVTRIDNDGLSLCKGSVQSGGDVDIVYAYDNSGSMKANLAYVNTSTHDTTYYESDVNCSNKARRSDSATFYSWNSAGTAQDVVRKVPRLASNTGCTEFSGDPINTRGRAFYLGVTDQAVRAPNSSAGIMSFTGSVGNIRRPKVLNSQANIDNIRGGISAISNGGTAYRPPTDTAKAWLTNPNITSNPKKAIIFLSDGKPKDDNPAWNGPSSGMPPIYGIFLGRPRSDTAALYSMSQSTGGKFYLIPPDDPDSLKSVVAAILNIVLLQYSPQTATVTNSSLTPAQSATSAAADFILQADGSWLMKLSDVIGLNRNASNSISFTTTFKEKNSGTTDTRTINFTISTTLAEVGTTQKIGTTQFGATCYDKSLLKIQNAAGVRPAYFTDADKNYRLRLKTGPGPLTSTQVPSSTGLKNDKENPTLSPPASSTADSLVFDGTNPFLVLSASKTDGNGTLESNLYDSIIVAWTHPRDQQDVATDFMLVRAATQGSAVWFSQTSGGPSTSLFPITATTAYIVVKDQPADPRRTYTAVVSSLSFGLDKETVTLTESPSGSGTLVGSVPINQTVGKNPADGKLQVSTLGDQLQVVYKDPVDGDSAVSTAGFAQLVEEAPDLKFTDASGTPLLPGTIWSPANGKLYISYSDDSVNIGQKQVFLTLASKKYGSAIAADHERIPLSLTTVNSETRATWTGSIDLAEAFPVADSNGKAEMRFRGEATITANSHTNLGAQEANVVTSTLLIAYPDSTAAISWKMDTTVTADEGLLITVKDQTFNVNQKDTALVSVACTQSGDSVSAIPAVEGPAATSGIYATGTLQKTEGAPNLGDKILSCLTTDQIRIRYVDPVYGTLTELFIDEVGKPVATPAGKTFISAEKVELASATPGADIYYTLDGSKPIPGVSPRYQDGQRLDINVTTTLKAIAVKPGMKDSKILTEVYTKQFVASRLEILDENGNAIPGGEITGAAKAVRVRLVTTQSNLTSADAPAATKVSGDAETVYLGNPGSLGDFIELWSDIPVKHPFAKEAGNDTIEAIGTDTLIVRWVNPFNPADAAADTITIKPAYVVAEVYFSASENGPKITEYPVNQDSIYVVVKTRPKDPALAYTVSVSSSELGLDKEVLDLTELSPGVFSAKAPVGTGSKTSGDETIQVAAAGDQLTAIFTDPVYKTDFRGDAGFAQGVQESALLEFIDESGNVLPPTGVWSPAKGKVYLRFSDDWNPGIAALIHTKTADLKLINRKSGDSVGADAESITLTLKDSTATRGTWEGQIILADKSASKAGNDTLESYFRGELRATVKPHTNAGLPTSPDAVDNLVIAYPDQPAEIVVRDTSGKSVERRTEKVEIIIRDQIFSNSGETSIKATVTCAQSGDRVSDVVLVWDPAANAYVIKPPLGKGETNGGAIDKADALLLCRDGDVLTVTYTDPVYQTQRTADVRWSDDAPSRFYYASTKDGSVITSISDAAGKDFEMVVEGKSPTRDKIDTIEVVLITDQGEEETYKAVETGIFTGKFVVKADFRFQSGEPSKKNQVVEARILVANRVNQVLVHGTAVIAGATLKADLALLSSYNLVAKAYMKDEDENGHADHAYFIFDHKLSRLPGGIDEVYWNQEGADFKKKAEGSILSFLAGSDSTIVVADFSKSQFGGSLYLTDIPSGKPGPYGRFPDDNLFGGQKAALADSMGPVITSALKLPSNLQSYNVTNTEKRFNPDTLVVTVSEKIKTSTNFSDMLRFSKGCADYKESGPVKMFNEPAVSADGLTWVIIVDNAPNTQAPLVKDCLFLEVDGRYTDSPGNRPARLGAELSGENPKLVIREFRGFPPVAGLDPSTPGFVISTNEKRDEQGGIWSNPSGPGGNSWVVTWIPPYGFDPKDPVGSLQRVANDFDNPKAGERHPEQVSPQPLPDGISTVQVIASGAYKAQIRIFDNLGHFVRSMEQAYGGNGEDKNPWRAANKGQVSFLVWDMKDKDGGIVGNGVYVWKVAFTFLEKTKKSEVMYTRTGVVRR